MHYSFSIDERRSSLLHQLKIRLLLSVCLLIFMLIIHTSVSIYITTLQITLNTQSLALRDDSSNLLTTMIDQDTGLRGYLATNTSLFLAPFSSGHTNYLSTLNHLKSLLSSSNFSHTASSLPTFEKSSDAWYQHYALPQLTNSQYQHQSLHQKEQTALQGKQLFDNFRAQAARLQVASQLDISQQQSWTVNINILSTFITLLLSLLVILLLWHAFAQLGRTLYLQLTSLENTATSLGNGDLTIRVPTLSSQEFDRLGKSFNSMAETLQQQHKATQERDILESVLQLNTLLTNTFDLKTLTETFLTKALAVLHLQLAALYLYDPQSQHLTLAGAQGFHFSELTRSFALGEGLVGTTAQSRTPLHLQCPEQATAKHFIVKTIVGDALPASLYQLPLIQGKDLIGVLVFGSLYPMSKNARNTLDVVSSNLAAVISHTIAYEHIQTQAAILAQKNREQEQTNLALRIQRDELRILNTALEETNRVRNQFLSIMTHELRTPLTAMLGFSQIVLRDMENDQSRSRTNIERVIKNGQHLLNLINDALDLIRLESGHMSVTTSRISLPSLLTEIMKSTQPMATEKHLSFTTTLDPNLDEIESDPDKLRQILLNLISNSIKFTEKGEVHITAIKKAEGENEGEQIILTVHDTGIGIAPEVQERIFDAFYQGDSTITRKYGGTGLGLSIVRQLTLLLGGTLALESSLGQGSTFTLLLPQRSPATKLNASQLEPQFATQARLRYT